MYAVSVTKELRPAVELIIGLSMAAILPLARADANAPLSFAAPLISPPVIDGQDTTADEWEGASRLTGWADNILGVANNDKTIVNVGHHQKTLYVRMIFAVPEKFRRNSVFYSESPLKVDVSENDGDIFQDDYLGFYLSPPESQDVYLFGVNGTGAKRDSKNGEIAWNGQWEASQKWDRNFWQVEFSLPLRAFLGKGAFTGNGAWGINSIHGARQVEPMESVWAFRPAQIRPLTEMHLSPEKVSVALLDFGDLNEGHLTFKGRIENRGTDLLEVESELEVADTASDRKVIFGPTKNSYVLKPGEKQDLVFDFRAPGSIFGDVTLRLRDAKGTQLLSHTLPFVFSRDIRMEARYIPTPELLLVILNLGSGAVEKVTGGVIRIISVDTGEEILVNQIDDLNESMKRIEIDCKTIPAGSYEVLTEFKLGSEVVSLKDDMTKEPQPEWLNNSVGISDEVVTPWIPLEVAGRTISCWGRDYTFGATGFPSQINILGQDLLTGPARISAKVDGKLYELEEGTFQPYENKNTRVSFKTVSNAGAVAIEGDTWMEFDGFV